VRALRWTAAAALVAAVAAGCGGEPAASTSSGGDPATSASSGAAPLGKESAGSVVQFADCGDWQKGSKAERYATVRVLRGQLTPQRSKTAASPLPDERAYQMLDRVCGSEAPESLRLYKLYVRMQGFAPLQD
jgi:hypothetical protein